MTAPVTAKPKIIIAQLAGSGTTDTNGLTFSTAGGSTAATNVVGPNPASDVLKAMGSGVVAAGGMRTVSTWPRWRTAAEALVGAICRAKAIAAVPTYSILRISAFSIDAKIGAEKIRSARALPAPVWSLKRMVYDYGYPARPICSPITAKRTVGEGCTLHLSFVAAQQILKPKCDKLRELI
jgi:hypothetical protein